jgi:hypothetical protein
MELFCGESHIQMQSQHKDTGFMTMRRARTGHPVCFRGQTSDDSAFHRKSGAEARFSQKNRFELSTGGEIVVGGV